MIWKTRNIINICFFRLHHPCMHAIYLILFAIKAFCKLKNFDRNAIPKGEEFFKKKILEDLYVESSIQVSLLNHFSGLYCTMLNVLKVCKSLIQTVANALKQMRLRYSHLIHYRDGREFGQVKRDEKRTQPRIFTDLPLKVITIFKLGSRRSRSQLTNDF